MSLTATLTSRPDGAAESSRSTRHAQTATSGAGSPETYTEFDGELWIPVRRLRSPTYQTILRGIVYDNTSDTPTTTTSILIVVHDGFDCEPRPQRQRPGPSR